MERYSIESSMIKSIGYDSNSSTLEIEFKSGEVWQYFDFLESLWHDFDSTDSKGKFFHREIKNQHKESRVG